MPHEADPVGVQKITDYRKMVAFRNILIHGYTHVDAAIVWDIVESKLDTLADEVEELKRHMNHD